MCVYALLKPQPRWSLLVIARAPLMFIYLILQGIYFVLPLVIIFGVAPLFCLLPEFVHRWIYFWFAYNRKLYLGLPPSVRNIPTWVSDYAAGRIPIRPRPLHYLNRRREVRTPEDFGLQLPVVRLVQAPIEKSLSLDILLLISQHLHYVDLVNLSLASRDLRQFIFPSDASTIKYLKTYCCGSQATYECWACFRPLCLVRTDSVLSFLWPFPRHFS